MIKKYWKKTLPSISIALTLTLTGSITHQTVHSEILSTSTKPHYAHPHNKPHPFILTPGRPFIIPVWNGKTQWSECSIGYPFTHNGESYFLTAGHCFFNIEDTKWGWFFHHTSGTNIYSENDSTLPIGEESLYIPAVNNSDLDVTIVRLFPGKTRIPRLTQYGINPKFNMTPRIGEPVCLLGENTYQPRCGSIVTRKYVNGVNIYGSPYHWNTIIQASYTSYPGDSGGLVYTPEGVAGINVGAFPGNNNGIFVPISTIVTVLKKHGFNIIQD